MKKYQIIWHVENRIIPTHWMSRKTLEIVMKNCWSNSLAERIFIVHVHLQTINKDLVEKTHGIWKALSENIQTKKNPVEKTLGNFGDWELPAVVNFLEKVVDWQVLHSTSDCTSRVKYHDKNRIIFYLKYSLSNKIFVDLRIWEKIVRENTRFPS